LRIASSGKWIEEADLALEIAEADAYALEAGLQLKEKHGGEVSPCAPDRRGRRKSSAKRSPRARTRHSHRRRTHGLDPLATARLLAAAIAPEAPDLVLTGLESGDLGHAQTGVMLAELLGLPHATIVMEVEVGNGRLRVKRELENGWFQRVEMPLPALVAVQSGIAKLRYGHADGNQESPNERNPARGGGGPGMRAAVCGAVIDRVYPPERSRRTQLLGGSPREAATLLVGKVAVEARAI